MGWLGNFVGYSLTSKELIDYVKTEIDNMFDKKKYEILKVSVKSFGKETYLAVKSIEKDYVFAMVILSRYSRKDGEVAFKVMDETVGPSYYKATATILKLLSPTTINYANDWRIECWKNFKNIPKEIKEDLEGKGYSF